MRDGYLYFGRRPSRRQGKMPHVGRFAARLSVMNFMFAFIDRATLSELRRAVGAPVVSFNNGETDFIDFPTEWRVSL